MDTASPFQGNVNPDLPQQQQHVPQQRKRLNLKPRDDKRAAQIQQQNSLLTSTSSLFGDAKPREVIIADRDGKTEEEVVREEVRKEKLQLRLTPEQSQEKLSVEAAVREIEEQMEREGDEKKREILKVELVARQQKLDGLLDRFAKEVLSEGGKHAGQRERYNPTRNTNEVPGVNGGMMNQMHGMNTMNMMNMMSSMNSMNQNVAGGLHQQYQYQQQHNNQYAHRGGHTGGYVGGGLGGGPGRGRQSYNNNNNNNNNYSSQGGYGGGRVPAQPQYAGGHPGGQPYAPVPGNPMHPTSHMHAVHPMTHVDAAHGMHAMNTVNTMTRGPGGHQPSGYAVPGHGQVAPVLLPMPQMHSGRGPGPAHGQLQASQPTFYQQTPAGVGIGGEIEFDAAEFNGAPY